MNATYLLWTNRALSFVGVVLLLSTRFVAGFQYSTVSQVGLGFGLAGLAGVLYGMDAADRRRRLWFLLTMALLGGITILIVRAFFS